MSLSDIYYGGLVRMAGQVRLSFASEAQPRADVPQPDGGTPPEELATMVEQALGLISWAGTAAGVMGVLVTGAVMAMSHKRGESSEHMSRLGVVLAGCILVATAGPIVAWVFGGDSGGDSGGGEAN
ncbi:hypothetical protein [Micromonospora sp. DT31]|uniref:hypothetical protein n=1 Tax=Micromonospora sp. DT31 TaxID=3393434 RepID=UPI003CE72E0C